MKEKIKEFLRLWWRFCLILWRVPEFYLLLVIAVLGGGTLWGVLRVAAFVIIVFPALAVLKYKLENRNPREKKRQ